MNNNTENISTHKLALGERRLLTAMLRRAVLDYFGEARDLVGEAEAWIFEEQGEEKPREYSFAWICECLSLDFETFSERLRSAKTTGAQNSMRATVEGMFM